MSLVSLFRMQPCVGFTRSGLKLWGNSSVYVKVLSFSETTHLQHYRLQSTKTGGRCVYGRGGVHDKTFNVMIWKENDTNYVFLEWRSCTVAVAQVKQD